MYTSSCKKRGCCKPKRLQQPLLFNQISGFRKRGGLLAQESIQLRLGLGHDVFEAGSAHLGHHLIHGGLGIAGTGLDQALVLLKDGLAGGNLVNNVGLVEHEAQSHGGTGALVLGSNLGGVGVLGQSSVGVMVMKVP